MRWLTPTDIQQIRQHAHCRPIATRQALEPPVLRCHRLRRLCCYIWTLLIGGPSFGFRAERVAPEATAFTRQLF